MISQVGTRTWSSATLLRGFDLVGRQGSMDLQHIHDVEEEDIDRMQQELHALEAITSAVLAVATIGLPVVSIVVPFFGLTKCI